MLDVKLLALVTETKAKLDRMKDARPSQIMAVKEDFAAALVAALDAPVDEISDAAKIAAFDAMRDNQVRILKEAVQRASQGRGYYFDEDEGHYTEEQVKKAVLGPKVYQATNHFETLLNGIKA